MEHTCEHFHKLKTWGIPVRFVRLDPEGENQKLAKHAGSSDWAMFQQSILDLRHKTPPNTIACGISVPGSSRKGSCHDGWGNGS